MTRYAHIVLSLILITSLTAACGALPLPTPTPQPAATPVTAAAPTPAPPATLLPAPMATNTLPPTATPAPSPGVALATPVPAATLADELTGIAKAMLPPAPKTPQPFGGFKGVNVMRLKTNLGNLWLAHTVGGHSYEPLVHHFVAVYSHGATGWQQVAKIELKCPDYLDTTSITQVQVDPMRIWLQVDGGAGAHGGCFDLLSFDGTSLRIEAHNAWSSPGAGRVEDLNGDGLGDVILNQTEAYVFCYACGVRFARFKVLTWDGARLAEVKLTPLPDESPASVREPANRAVALAQGGLWKEAQAAMAQVMALNIRNPTLTWNAALIRLHAEAQASNITGGYPLLGYVFYGDYDAALAMMRAYRPEVLFSTKSPLVTGTVAEGWEKNLTYWITSTTTLALKVKPDLAEAYFLRGWAVNLTRPGSPDALADIEKAAHLNPGDALFSESAAYFKNR